MELSTTASGRLTPHLDMEEELKFGQMAASTRDTGRPIKLMAEEGLSMLMVMSTTVNGKTIKLMDMANTLIPTVPLTRATGRKISNMV